MENGYSDLANYLHQKNKYKFKQIRSDCHIIVVMLLILQKINSPNLAYHIKLYLQLKDKLKVEATNTVQKCYDMWKHYISLPDFWEIFVMSLSNNVTKT